MSDQPMKVMPNIDAQYSEEMGQIMRVTWTLRRAPLNLDNLGTEPSLTRTINELCLEINPQLLASEPEIILIAGDRRFRVIEDAV